MSIQRKTSNKQSSIVFQFIAVHAHFVVCLFGETMYLFMIRIAPIEPFCFGAEFELHINTPETCGCAELKYLVAV